MAKATQKGAIIAHHLVISGYGHWLPNDLRGSGSAKIRRNKFEDLGPIHSGRKRQQPSQAELRAFFDQAADALEYPVLWFDDAERAAVGDAIRTVIARRRYTVWACAVLRDHVHLCIRVHRDDYQTMWRALTDQACNALRALRPEWKPRPIWAERPYSVYLHTAEDVRRVVRYIQTNPKKHGLQDQEWEFVKEYDGWPLHKRGRDSR